MSCDDIWIYWDDDMKFTNWEVKTKDNTYHCTILIVMSDGIPTAEIVVAGSKSSRSCTIPLKLKN